MVLLLLGFNQTKWNNIYIVVLLVFRSSFIDTWLRCEWGFTYFLLERQCDNYYQIDVFAWWWLAWTFSVLEGWSTAEFVLVSSFVTWDFGLVQASDGKPRLFIMERPWTNGKLHIDCPWARPDKSWLSILVRSSYVIILVLESQFGRWPEKFKLWPWSWSEVLDTVLFNTFNGSL